MATRTRPVANVKTTKEVKGATFDDEAGVRTLQCQFHKPQSPVAAGAETNYDVFLCHEIGTNCGN